MNGMYLYYIMLCYVGIQNPLCAHDDDDISKCNRSLYSHRVVSTLYVCCIRAHLVNLCMHITTCNLSAVYRMKHSVHVYLCVRVANVCACACDVHVDIYMYCILHFTLNVHVFSLSLFLSPLFFYFCILTLKQEFLCFGSHTHTHNSSRESFFSSVFNFICFFFSSLLCGRLCYLFAASLGHCVSERNV